MPKLAIKGGTPVAPGGLRIKWPEFDDEEREALLRVLESGHWWRGEREDSEVGKFEDEWANFIGTKHAVAVSSGTAALIVALRAAGIEAGDEVLVPTTTFVATATAVVLSNAVPIFVDMLPDTYQMDPDAAEASITEKTRASLWSTMQAIRATWTGSSRLPKSTTSSSSRTALMPTAPSGGERKLAPSATSAVSPSR